MSVSNYRNGILMTLCITSGIVDVIGYLQLGHVFTANMTGNIVLLGMAIGQAEGVAVFRALVAFLAFVAGTAFSALIIGRKKESTFWPASVTVVLIIELLLFVLFAIMNRFTFNESSNLIMIILLSVAMGMQTTAARKLNVAGISTTVLTNNLANVVEDLVAHGRRRLSRTAETASNALSPDSILRITALLTYGLGAIIGTYAHHLIPVDIIWLPIVMMVGTIVIARTLFHEKKLSH